MSNGEKEKGYRRAEPDSVQKRALRILKGIASFEDRFLDDHGELVRLVDSLRKMGCVIAFVTGVWDLIHIGHADYITLGKAEAVKLYPDADHVVLVVGVDSDDLTKRRKGPSRPIVPEEERFRMIGHLRAVDILTPQREEGQLFKILEHDVRIISTSTEDLPGFEEIRAQCDHVVNLPPQAKTSTTARIRGLSLDGAFSVLEKVENSLSTMLKEVRDGLGKR